MIRRAPTAVLQISPRLAAAIGLCLLAAGCTHSDPPPPPAPAAKTYSQAEPAPAAPEAIPDIRFTDITRAAGVNFVHTSGLSAKKYMPETMGSGGGFFDYDGDGDLDLFLFNARPIEPGESGAEPPVQALFQNDGKGRFTDVTRAAGLAVTLYGMGCAMADVDGDGDQDLFITAAIDGNRFFRNNGNGTFTEATREAGLESPLWQDEKGGKHPFWSTACAFLDYDRDGRLDLFVANYIQWSVENDVYTTRAGVGKTFTVPTYYQGQACLLYRNRGGGAFEDVSARAGILGSTGKSLGAAIEDFDGDELPDIAVSNDTQPNFLFRNQGDGTFREIGLRASIAFDELGRARAGMGIDSADYGNDGRPAIAIGNFSSEPVSLYRMMGPLTFVDAAGQARITRATLLPLTFGLAFFDYDLDGYRDLALANGHIEPDIQKVEEEVTYEQPQQLLRNLEGKRFVDATNQAGADLSRPMVGRGLAFADIDSDGDLDLLITSCGGRPRLLRNDDASRGARFIRFRLRGRTPNTDAIGARVQLTTGGRTRSLSVRTGSSYLSQSELVLTFGLGAAAPESAADAIEKLAIHWPGGAVETIAGERLAGLRLNALNELRQPQ